jgi:hypothetical protein
MNLIINSKSCVNIIVGKRRSGKTHIISDITRRLTEGCRLVIFSSAGRSSQYTEFLNQNVLYKNIETIKYNFLGHTKNTILFFDDFFQYHNFDFFDYLYLNKFCKIYFVGTPIHCANCKNVLQMINEIFKNNVSFFEISGGMLNECDQLTYNLTLEWIHNFFRISSNKYSKFQLINFMNGDNND